MVDLTDPLETVVSILKNSSTGIGTTGYEITDDDASSLTITDGEILVSYTMSKDEVKAAFGGTQDYDVIMRGIDGGSSRRLALIHNNDRPRWVSVEPSLQRFVYVLQDALGKTLYSSQVGSVTTNQISTTPHAKAHIYGPDQILYSGPDGRFYRSNYDGSILTPFWPAVDPG